MQSCKSLCFDCADEEIVSTFVKITYHLLFFLGFDHQVEPLEDDFVKQMFSAS